MKIYLISRPAVNESDLKNFLRDEGLAWRRRPSNKLSKEGEELIELAGRICYMSFGTKQHTEPNGKYIDNLIRMGHHSVLEHLNWSFIITGVSRAFTHQLVRHRIGFSYSQLSQQYHKEDNVFVIPEVIKKNPKALKKWKEVIELNKRSYNDLMEILNDSMKNQGSTLSKKEINRLVHSASRSILPNAKETKIFVSSNARALRNLLDSRASIPGDYEMREFTIALLKMLKKETHNLFSDFEVIKHSDGKRIIRKRIE